LPDISPRFDDAISTAFYRINRAARAPVTGLNCLTAHTRSFCWRHFARRWLFNIT
jgi:hypothetical protein